MVVAKEPHPNDIAGGRRRLIVAPSALAEGGSATVTVVPAEAPFATDQTVTLAFASHDTDADAVAPGADYTLSVGGTTLRHRNRTLANDPVFTSPQPHYDLTLPAGWTAITATVTAVDDDEVECYAMFYLLAFRDGALFNGKPMGSDTLTIKKSDQRPQLDSAVIDGNTVTLTFSRALRHVRQPPDTHPYDLYPARLYFWLYTGLERPSYNRHGVPRPRPDQYAETFSLSGRQVVLTFAEPVAADETVWVVYDQLSKYAPLGDGSGGNCGRAVSSFIREATNATPASAHLGATDDAPAMLVADAEAREGRGATLDFAVTLDPAATASVAVDYATRDGTATAGTDYEAASGRLVFEPGRTRKTVSVPLVDDDEADDGETFTLRLYDVSGAHLVDAEAVGTIRNTESPTADEPPPPASLTANFEGLPAEHDGASPFTFLLRFSEPPAVSFRTLRDQSFQVAGGTVQRARRVDGRNDLREIHVAPSSYGEVTVTLAGGRACHAAGGICTADGRRLANTLSATIPGPAAITVADAWVREGTAATIDFTVTLDRTAHGAVTAGADYTATSGTLIFTPGETEQTVTVTVLDDAHDEGEETFTLHLSNATGAALADAAATGTIANRDPLPRAWLARFGRTVAGHVLEAVGERLAAPRAASQVTIGGHRLSRTARAATAAETREAYQRFWEERMRGARRWEQPRTIELDGLVAGSSFNLSATAPGAHEDESADGGRWSVWGRGAWSRFEGSDRHLSLNGTVLTATAGADYERGRLLTGLAVAYSSGDGSFHHSAAPDSGTLKTTLLGVHPYLRLTLHEHLAVWGLFGYAVAGELTLDRAAADPVETGAGMLMGAFGARGTLLPAAATGGFELVATADALLLRMRSEAAADLTATTAEVQRLRLLLRASQRAVPLVGGLLTPDVEVGGRYDGGDAESGAGLVVGGSLRYAQPAWGLTLTAGGKGLLRHESGAFREWGAGGSLRLDPGTPGRGVALRVDPSWGTTGGITAATLWALPDAARLAAPAPAQPQPGARIAAELSYGLDAPGGNGALTPYAGVALADGGTLTWRLGGRLSIDPGLSLSLEGSRGEHAGKAPEHRLELRGTVRY